MSLRNTAIPRHQPTDTGLPRPLRHQGGGRTTLPTPGRHDRTLHASPGTAPIQYGFSAGDGDQTSGDRGSHTDRTDTHPHRIGIVLARQTARDAHKGVVREIPLGSGTVRQGLWDYHRLEHRIIRSGALTIIRHDIRTLHLGRIHIISFRDHNADCLTRLSFEYVHAQFLSRGITAFSS